MVAAWIVRRYIVSVTCVAILIVAIVTAATWAQLQALRRQHQWRHHRRAPYDHLLGYHIAFRPYTMLGTVQRSNRASGMLESTIRWCVCLCCSTACPTVAQPRERSSSRVGRRRNKSPCRIYMHYHSNRTGNISLEPALIKLATPALHGANRGTWDRRHEWEHRPVYMTPNGRHPGPGRAHGHASSLHHRHRITILLNLLAILSW